MTYLLIFLLLLTSALSGLLLWYIRGLLSNYQIVIDTQVETQQKIISYADHLKKVYEMDSYYGDSTLESLLKHTSEVEKSLRESLVIGRDIYNEQDIDDE